MREHTDNTAARVMFNLAGAACMLAAAFQAVISFSPAWSLWFRAPRYLVERPLLLAVAGMFVAVLLALVGLYGFSAAGGGRLPRKRLILFSASAVFVLRGFGVAPQALALLGLLDPGEPVAVRDMVASLVALVMGLLIVAGLRAARPRNSSEGRP